ncbi:MAG: glycoside hydrolase family 3 protein [Thermoproteales archaeon]|nr:glycoside hydrolase family 3 protein [Thermoproteales archaeon]
MTHPIDIDKIVSQLSLEEKAMLVVGRGMPGSSGNPPSRVPGAAGETYPIPRLGIPPTVFADGPAGLRIKPVREGDSQRYHATAFPIAVMLASTWNPEILYKVGRAMGEEVKEYGVDILLAPAINIHRNPLCGRNFEYYSEDPFLSGEMASAFVKGVQSRGVGACIKHFVANNQETNRYTIDTVVSERALREIYLRNFEIVVKKAQPWTVMSAYNKLNGSYCSQNKWLLTKVLREEWGFQGFVMTDWYAGDDPVEQMKAGNDMIMPGKAYQVDKSKKDEIKEIISAVKEGRLSEDVLDRNIRNILRILSQSPSFQGYKYSNKPDLDDHAKISYEAGAEGLVLLENRGVLPLDKNERIALFGTGQIETIKGGTGSGDTHPRYVINILSGLDLKGFRIDRELSNRYKKYVDEMRQKDEYKPKGVPWSPIIPSLPQDIITEDEVEKYAQRNDVAVIVISRISGENYDRKPIKGDFYLSDDEKNLLEKVSKTFHRYGKKVIVILNIGAPIEIESWKNLVDAILLIWQPGQEAGHIVADALIGEINPSGKLPVTFPKDYSDVPSWNFPGTPPEDPKKVVYFEDIYVGYRYYDTFGIEPSYPFGYGLSYTTFEYRDLKTELKNDVLIVSFTVKNTGRRKGKEVAQVYISAPRGKLDKPLQELKAFYKTKLLMPGEEEKIKLEIPLRDITSFDGGEWLLEAGEYEIRIGASSRDIRLTGKITIEEEKTYKL